MRERISRARKHPSSDTPIKLIELRIAAADDRAGMSMAEFSVLGQKSGYFYRAIRFWDEKEGALDEDRFAACTFP